MPVTDDIGPRYADLVKKRPELAVDGLEENDNPPTYIHGWRYAGSPCWKEVAHALVQCRFADALPPYHSVYRSLSGPDGATAYRVDGTGNGFTRSPTALGSLLLYWEAQPCQ